MKLRTGFVTNSSSVSYLIALPSDTRLHEAIGLFKVFKQLLGQPRDTEVTSWATRIVEVSERGFESREGTEWYRDWAATRTESFVKMFNDGYKLYYVSIPYHPYKDKDEQLKEEFHKFLDKSLDGIEVVSDHEF